MGIKRINIIRVPHGNISSFAISMTDVEQETVVIYSGDTQPCSNRLKILVHHAKIDCAELGVCLIHEATLDSEKVTDARDKSHTTFKEALQVGRELDAKLFLTHFSQRYNYFTKENIITEYQALEDSLKQYFTNNTQIAFDMMVGDVNHKRN
mmetsp:Transcript_22312/g.49816  ORF Transcript_22312/g.49816 Transcript_22312/m.49816 type:complete len:152 (-) Transcript_22312:102-557(-)|eukprot:CAMPEP_0116900112 /NCGR_PEP_ID=MMETSP0467-20121206/8508_1 /TAXON_ID=283647 /ORGANISM="Mesodinium pulex, Strain SPMC105" /LENGTH=151 /DNA_ID=CAMNT_0004573261 /DNA_START=1086 /DNA_END=1541 /DNA_ORIENTATION=+